ncbi:MAG: Mur ligase family protein [Oscillospiraceae bacterium]
MRVTDVRRAQSLAARWFYDNPSDSLTLIGVTGTKGKTTTSYMIQAVTNALAGRTMGLSSSAGRYCGGPDVDTHLTTPESLDLQWLFAQARDHGLPYMTAEVSSQAYQVERVYGEHFDIGVFLNFSEDHISPRSTPPWRSICNASSNCWKTAAGP